MPELNERHPVADLSGVAGVLGDGMGCVTHLDVPPRKGKVTVITKNAPWQVR